MARASIIFTALIMAFVLFFLGLGLFYYQYPWRIMRFPLAVGLAIVLFCIASLAAEIRTVTAGAAGPEADEDLLPARADFRRDLVGMAWTVGILPAIFLCGYVAGLPLYVFVYFKTHGQGWITSAIYALAALAVVYLGFFKLLSVPLPVMPFDMR